VYEAEIRNGLTLFDEKLGRDAWLPRVNPAHINMTSCVSCIAAQATGETYAEALVTLDIMPLDVFQKLRRNITTSLPSDVFKREAHYGFEVIVEPKAKPERLMTNLTQLEREWQDTIAAMKFPD
jgi:hypothetical protein